jgi:hypothetical protein
LYEDCQITYVPYKTIEFSSEEIERLKNNYKKTEENKKVCTTHKNPI